MKLLALSLLAFSALAQVPLPGGSGGGGGGGGSSTATAFQAGTLAARPAGCTSGPTKVDVYYATDAAYTTGLSRFFVCTFTDVWTQQGAQGNADGSVTITSSASGLIDIQVTPGVFVMLAAANTYTGGGLQDFGTSIVDLGRLAADPGTCAVGSIYFNTVSAVFRGCLVTNTWSAISGLAVSNPAGTCIPTSNAGGTALDCQPGSGGGSTQSLFFNGFNFSIRGVPQLYWGGNGNAVTCATTAAIPDNRSGAIKFNLTGNCTLTANTGGGGQVDGGIMIVELCQDSMGGRTITWPATYTTPVWTTPGSIVTQTAITTTANTCSVVMFMGDQAKAKYYAIAPGMTGQ